MEVGGVVGLKFHPIGAVCPVIIWPLLNKFINELDEPKNMFIKLVTLYVFHIFPFVVIFWLKNIAFRNMFAKLVTFDVFQFNGFEPGICFCMDIIPVKILLPKAVVNVRLVLLGMFSIALE